MRVCVYVCIQYTLGAYDWDIRIGWLASGYRIAGLFSEAKVSFYSFSSLLERNFNLCAIILHVCDICSTERKYN